jgi:tryptophan synthase beta subunit
MKGDQIMIVNLSGRGDKDIDSVRSKITTEDTEKSEPPAVAGG